MKKLKFLLPIGFLAVTALFAVAVMLLWNWLVPLLFGLITINFWQALGILVLCRILFGNFNGRRHRMHCWHGGKLHDRHYIREKWMKMTPDERKEFVSKIKNYFDKNEADIDTSATDGNSSKKHD
jgi:membrane protein required for beta-lactamase induction